MTHANTAVRVGGTWLAVASFLMIVVLGFHGPIAPDLNDQMMMIANAPARWSVVHWIASAALSLYAVTGLILLTAQSRLTEGRWTMTAWAVITIGALWTVTTAVAETTVVSNAAVSGSKETFDAWWAFASGKGNGFAMLALAVAVIAGNEARVSLAGMPTWSSWAATVAGIASFAGWALGMWFGIAIGNLLWVVATIVMSVWTLWFGVVLMRFQANVR
jgi:hypothetical protein